MIAYAKCAIQFDKQNTAITNRLTEFDKSIGKTHSSTIQLVNSLTNFHLLYLFFNPRMNGIGTIA